MELIFLASAAGEAASPIYATFWATIGLIVFLGICIYAGVHKTMAKGLDSRAEKIRNELDEARQLREEAQV